MSNMHRLMWFDKQIRNYLYPNRSTLAEKFEISTRQAQRDIDYLKNSLGAPVKYDPKRRGYFYSDRAYILPNVYVNDIQRKMLKFLAYRYENYTQTPKVVQMAELFKKLAYEDEVDDEVPIFDLEKPIVQTYYAVYRAVIGRNKLKLEYMEPYRGMTEMMVDPYKLFYKYRTDYLAAYDNSECKIVILRLDRIVKLDILQENFLFREGLDLSDCRDIAERDPFIARLEFKDNRMFEEKKGTHVRKVGEKLYEIEFFDVEDFINTLLCTGYWEGIISPKWLKNKLVERCEDIIKKLVE